MKAEYTCVKHTIAESDPTGVKAVKSRTITPFTIEPNTVQNSPNSNPAQETTTDFFKNLCRATSRYKSAVVCCTLSHSTTDLRVGGSVPM